MIRKGIFNFELMGGLSKGRFVFKGEFKIEKSRLFLVLDLIIIGF